MTFWKDKWQKKYQKLKFDRKMFVFISSALWTSVIILTVVSVGSSVRAIVAQSRRLVEQRVETLASNTAENFKQYENILWGIMMDSGVQAYLQDDSRYGYYNPAKLTLDNVINMMDKLQFVGLIAEDGEKSMVTGDSIPNSNSRLSELILEDYEKSLKMSSQETSMRAMTYNTKYSRSQEYSLMIYQPVYSGSQLDEYIGLAYLNIDDLNLTQTLEDDGDSLKMDNFFLYADGTIISCSDAQRIGSQLDISRMTQRSGSYWDGVNLCVYYKLTGWNYLYVTNISIYELCKENVAGIIIVLLILFFLLVLIQRLAGRIISDAYRPWQRVAETMGEVTQGNLDARLEEQDTDPDMEMISQGFNQMMETVLQLMDQVKEEQHLLDQVKFDALQSQIQPHFLYNTLDCIHWQAVLDGNKEISDLVKALAAYYRICLSKGRDIITVREEMAHIANYLYIQRMRYGDILSYEIEGIEELEKIQIPKLTLQPLVENSIYHGIKVKEGMKGRVRIRGERQTDCAMIYVEDNGTGMTDEQIAHINESIEKYEENMGYGVRNVNRRIQLLFGEEYGLCYQHNETGGITVQVRVPLENADAQVGLKSADRYFQ